MKQPCLGQGLMGVFATLMSKLSGSTANKDWPMLPDGCEMATPISGSHCTICREI